LLLKRQLKWHPKRLLLKYLLKLLLPKRRLNPRNNLATADASSARRPSPHRPGQANMLPGRYFVSAIISPMTDPEMTLSTGQQLRQAREARKLSLEQVATYTRIRLHYLAALEADDISAFPSAVQARGFLRTYAGYLGLDTAMQTSAIQTPGAPAASLEVESAPAPAAASTALDLAPEEAETRTGQAESIFALIGQKLRGQRELLGLALNDVERHTHLRAHYLQALEAGDLDGLPSPVQGKGMLKNYASFLGLDTESLLLRYAEGLQARLSAKQQLKRPERRSPVRKMARRRLFSLDFIIGGILVIALIGISEIRSRQTPAATAPSIAEVLASSPTPPVSPTNTLATPTEALLGTVVASTAQGTPIPSPTLSSAAVQVYIVARQRAWMRVIVDGKVAFEGRVLPGNAYPYAGSEQVELLTGNGAALQVFYQQEDLGLLGSFGEVAERIFTVTGVQTPTATITPTPLPVTPTITPTVQGTGTPRP
jgi:cytoskeletal protein RodZ